MSSTLADIVFKVCLPIFGTRALRANNSSSFMAHPLLIGTLIVMTGLVCPAVQAQEAVIPAAADQPISQQNDDQKPDDAPRSGGSAGAAPVDPNTYKIGLSDVIRISVWREPELSGTYTVRPDGKISMALAGDIEADGATPEELKKRVLEALSRTMVNPEVMLEVAQVNSKKFLITGEVGRSGAYLIVTPITVLEAISVAGGLKDFANGKKIFILRNGERIKFNYKDVIKGKNMQQNIEIKPGDHIIVP